MAGLSLGTAEARVLWLIHYRLTWVGHPPTNPFLAPGSPKGIEGQGTATRYSLGKLPADLF